MNKELRKYINENLKKEKRKFSFKRLFISNEIENLDEQPFFENTEEKSNIKFGQSKSKQNISQLSETQFEKNDYAIKAKKELNLNEFIEENKNYNNFQTTLFKMIDDRKLIDSDVYNKVHIDRRLFSKIRNDSTYHPSKETVLLLGLSLELNEEEIENLLNSASYSLPRNNHYDLIIRFCFMKGIYKLTEVNELLSEYKCKLFNY